ncbi:unnamed protein product [Lactuca saligna]|uniref:Uncharacterized protein n=1 Tax=Lactuca saligna TaxID=75948 RepID=A0AA35ZSM4_LACSI|nr:unnamed protein product [Lactuca saligna]
MVFGSRPLPHAALDFPLLSTSKPNNKKKTRTKAQPQLVHSLLASNLLKTGRNRCQSPLAAAARRSLLTAAAHRLLLLVVADFTAPSSICLRLQHHITQRWEINIHGPMSKQNAYCSLVLKKYKPWVEKGHPKAASLKTVPLLFPELCAELFDGNSASGNLSYATSQTPSGHGSSSFHVAPLHLMDAPSINIDEDDFFSNHTSEHFTQPSPSAASPSGNPNKRAKPSTPRPRAPSASPDPPSSASPKASITADDLALEMQKALRHLTQGPTIPQCLEKLELLELDPIDPLRFAAYHIFGGTMNMREMWVNLPNDPRILRGWIEMTATSLGVLKDGKIVR